MATSEGLSVDERNAVKQRAKELREQEKAGRNRAAGEKAVREAIEPLEGSDRDIAEGMYRVVSDVAPGLVPKTYYGMPGFANAAGKIVVFMQPAAKFGTRYATVGFDPAAHLDDGDFWATSFAVLAWTPEFEKKLAELVRTAAG
ncbi:hypothetical protein LEP48_02745 [Isoptericola sp. NEAU-Y5]|uniref:DUF1801 domain-containing protein n=1 Tax=Isoptericola luteus TaxID=2879484 RepID=A0ABS7ZB34_9MICO|nr:hypothetical protein [Isoptericola sp. NEAU-Y5]MCA5892268.1 hypothetical protein [Isoptericola sp. NEAU-Y5]